MSTFTTAEAKARLAALTPRTRTLDRGTSIDGSEVIQSVKDISQRALHSNIDALYYLVELAVTVQRVRLTELSALLLFIERLVLAANTQDMTASRTSLDAVLTVMEDLEVASAGDRIRLLRLLSRRTAEFAQSSKTASGSKKVGISPRQARESLASVSERFEKLMLSASTGAAAIENAVLDFVSAGLLDDAFGSQATAAREVMGEHTQEPETDSLSYAVLDAILLESLLNQRVLAVNPSQDKYSGTVTSTLSENAALLGLTLPLTASAAGVATVEVDGGPASDSITGPAATGVVMSIPIAAGDLIRSEHSTHGTLPDGIITSFVFFSKQDVIPGSVSITTTVSGLVVEYRDDYMNANLFLWDGATLAAPPVGTVVYDTGVVVINFPTAPDAGAGLYITNKYALIGRNDAYDDFTVFIDNTITTVTVDLAMASVTSVTSLAAALDLAFGTIAVTDVGSDIILTTDRVGTSARLLLPDYAAPVPNLEYGGAKWLVAPTKLNQVIGAVQASIPDAQGRDTALNQLIVGAAISALVTVDTLPELIASGTVTVTDIGGTSPKEFAIPGLQVDDIIIVQSPVSASYRVASATDTVATTSQEALRQLASGEIMNTSVVCSYTVRRDRLRVVSLANTAVGLGLAGSAYGTISTMTMGEEPTLQYSVRKGDPLIVGSVEIGEVTKVVGPVLSVKLNGAQINPVTSVIVRSKGAHRFVPLQSVLQGEFARWATLTAANVFSIFKTYAVSGSNIQQYASTMTEVRAAVLVLQTAYAAYDAINLADIVSLLTYLSTEKMSIATEYLLALNFVGLAGLTSADLSKQARLEYMLETAALDFNSGNDQTEWYSNDTLLSDYTVRNRDELV